MIAQADDFKKFAQTLDPSQRDTVLPLLETFSKSLLEKDQKIDQLTQQLDWFKRQLFGQKSEKRDMEDNPYQTTIADLLNDLPELPKPQPEERQTITYERGKQKKNGLDGSPDDSGLRFSKDVPVKEIEITPAELLGDNKDSYEIVSYKTIYRLAQRPSSHVVLKYIRPIIKEKASERIVTTSAPENVLDKSLADVSFLVGMLIDKFVYHLPLYRQHQRLEHAGIVLARSTLTNLSTRAILLLKAIFEAQLQHILQSKTLAIDETPIKAGKEKKGKLKQGYFWPIYGEDDEVCFTYSDSRGTKHLFAQLGEFSGTVLSDGYCAYRRFVDKCEDAKLAQCWVHTRRKFDETKDRSPEECAIALAYIGKIYEVEESIRKEKLNAKQTIQYRQEYSQPVIEAFFTWCYEQHQRIDLVPSDPFLKAVSYARNREHELKVFLSDASVAPDTNHVERALRVIPMGKKNWLFSWTEIGADLIGIIQSLLVTCRLHEVNPYDYLVDVLQRIDQHPAANVVELTPRVWKEKFADNPLRSDLHEMGG